MQRILLVIVRAFTLSVPVIALIAATLFLGVSVAHAVKSDSYYIEGSYAEGESIELKGGPALGNAQILFLEINSDGYSCFPENKKTKIVCTSYNSYDQRITLFTTYSRIDADNFLYTINGIQVGKGKINDPMASDYFARLVRAAKQRILIDLQQSQPAQ